MRVRVRSWFATHEARSSSCRLAAVGLYQLLFAPAGGFPAILHVRVLGQVLLNHISRETSHLEYSTSTLLGPMVLTENFHNTSVPFPSSCAALSRLVSLTLLVSLHRLPSCRCVHLLLYPHPSTHKPPSSLCTRITESSVVPDVGNPHYVLAHPHVWLMTPDGEVFFSVQMVAMM